MSARLQRMRSWAATPPVGADQRRDRDRRSRHLDSRCCVLDAPYRWHGDAAQRRHHPCDRWHSYKRWRGCADGHRGSLRAGTKHMDHVWRDDRCSGRPYGDTFRQWQRVGRRWVRDGVRHQCAGNYRDLRSRHAAAARGRRSQPGARSTRPRCCPTARCSSPAVGPMRPRRLPAPSFTTPPRESGRPRVRWWSRKCSIPRHCCGPIKSWSRASAASAMTHRPALGPLPAAR